MTETGILNRDIAAQITKLGHTDRMMITDAGFAIPAGVPTIDVSVAENLPTALQMLDEVLKHFSVEKVVISQATVDVSPSRYQEFLGRFGPDVEKEVIPHSQLRAIAKDMKFIIRTGDFTANSNIVLVSGGGSRWYCEK